MFANLLSGTKIKTGRKWKNASNSILHTTSRESKANSSRLEVPDSPASFASPNIVEIYSPYGSHGLEDTSPRPSDVGRNEGNEYDIGYTRDASKVDNQAQDSPTMRHQRVDSISPQVHLTFESESFSRLFQDGVRGVNEDDGDTNKPMARSNKDRSGTRSGEDVLTGLPQRDRQRHTRLRDDTSSFVDFADVPIDGWRSSQTLSHARKLPPAPIKIPTPNPRRPKLQTEHSSDRSSVFPPSSSRKRKPPTAGVEPQYPPNLVSSFGPSSSKVKQEDLLDVDEDSSASPASSAISGTTIARALIANTFILSPYSGGQSPSPSRASSRRASSRYKLTRQDSATLPRRDSELFGTSASPHWRISGGPNGTITGVYDDDDVPPVPPLPEQVAQSPASSANLYPPPPPITPRSAARKARRNGSIDLPGLASNDGLRVLQGLSSPHPPASSASSSNGLFPHDIRQAERRISRISEVSSPAPSSSHPTASVSDSASDSHEVLISPDQHESSVTSPGPSTGPLSPPFLSAGQVVMVSSVHNESIGRPSSTSSPAQVLSAARPSPTSFAIPSSNGPLTNTSVPMSEESGQDINQLLDRFQFVSAPPTGERPSFDRLDGFGVPESADGHGDLMSVDGHTQPNRASLSLDGHGHVRVSISGLGTLKEDQGQEEREGSIYASQGDISSPASRRSSRGYYRVSTGSIGDSGSGSRSGSTSVSSHRSKRPKLDLQPVPVASRKSRTSIKPRWVIHHANSETQLARPNIESTNGQQQQQRSIVRLPFAPRRPNSVHVPHSPLGSSDSRSSGIFSSVVRISNLSQLVSNPSASPMQRNSLENASQPSAPKSSDHADSASPASPDIFDYILGPVTKGISTRQRSGSAPPPIRVVRGPAEKAYPGEDADLVDDGQSQLPQSPGNTPSTGSANKQTFPETPSVFSPLWSASANTPYVAPTPASAEPTPQIKLAQQVILTRSLTNPVLIRAKPAAEIARTRAVLTPVEEVSSSGGDSATQTPATASAMTISPLREVYNRSPSTSSAQSQSASVTSSSEVASVVARNQASAVQDQEVMAGQSSSPLETQGALAKDSPIQPEAYPPSPLEDRPPVTVVEEQEKVSSGSPPDGVAASSFHHGEQPWEMPSPPTEAPTPEKITPPPFSQSTTPPLFRDPFGTIPPPPPLPQNLAIHEPTAPNQTVPTVLEEVNPASSHLLANVPPPPYQPSAPPPALTHTRDLSRESVPLSSLVGSTPLNSAGITPPPRDIPEVIPTGHRTSSISGPSGPRARRRPPLPLGPRRPSANASAPTYRDRQGSVSSVVSNPRTGSDPPMSSHNTTFVGGPTTGHSTPRFHTTPVSWRGMTLEAAQWTLSSAELQNIVSRAIRQSGKAPSIRLLTIEILDDLLPKEVERLEANKTRLKTQYKVEARKRATYLSNLMSLLDGEQTGGPASALYQVEKLTAATNAMDRITEELYDVMEQLAQLSRLQDVHYASALAMALRKLNSSFLSKAEENSRLREEVGILRAEVEDGWKTAEKAARDYDNLNSSIIDSYMIPSEPPSAPLLSAPSSNRSSTVPLRLSQVSIARKSSVRVSKAGLRSSSSVRRSRHLSSTSSFRQSLASSVASPTAIPPVPPIPHPLDFVSDNSKSRTHSTIDSPRSLDTNALLETQIYTMFGLAVPESARQQAKFRPRSLSGLPTLDSRLSQQITTGRVRPSSEVATPGMQSSTFPRSGCFPSPRHATTDDNISIPF